MLVVDDSAFMRRAIRSMIEAAPDMQVVGVAHNGLETVEQAAALSALRLGGGGHTGEGCVAGVAQHRPHPG
ncbi:MAG: hypothetical protein WC058_05080 [Phycisphaeraceae bacterium]